MNKKWLLVGLVLIVLVSGCIQKETNTNETITGGMPVKGAVPIFYSNITINSDSKAQEVFNENFEEIVNNVKINLENDEYFIRHYSGLRLICIENSILLSNHTKFERRKFEYFSTHWIGFEEFDKEQYTFIVPIAPKDRKWKYENEKVLVEDIRCKGMPSGQQMMLPIEMINATYDELKEYLSIHCKEGIIETWEPLSYSLRFIMDSNGTVYMAGSYCPK